jgi:ureidoacrylate peracid hydrolase
MHPTDLPQFAIDGALRRRGRMHFFEALDPARTALVVIDMQNVFMQEGAPAETPVARDIVPNINRLAGAMRETGGTVVWVSMTHTPADLDDWSVFYEALSGSGRGALMQDWLKDGSDGHKLWPTLEVADGDWLINKNRFSAFLPGSSGLAERLQGEGIDTLVIVGTLTNICCESSARDAMMRNFGVLMVSDANAARTDEEHLATLATIFQTFGDVQSTDEVVALLHAGAAGRTANAAE